MSYELQLAAEARAIAQAVQDELVLIKEHLGEDFKAFMADVEARKAAAVEAAKPLELTQEEKDAIVAARAEILKVALAKKAAPAA